MTAPTYPIINGHAYGFSSIELSLGGTIKRGFKEITYSQKREVGKLRGNMNQVIARTRGTYDAEGSLTLYAHEFNDLVAAWGAGWMEKVFTISVTYSEYGPLGTSCDVLYACTIINVEEGGSEGTDPLEVKIDLDIMKIKKNGKNPMLGMV